MSFQESEKRAQNVFSCLEEALEALHPGEGERLCRVLRERFFTPAAVFEADSDVLEQLGLSARDALLLRLVPALARYTGRESFGKSPRLDTAERAGAFLGTRFIGKRLEEFYLLCLDSNLRLIQSILLERGTTDRAPFYPRHVLREAVRTHAAYLIVSHNHPNNSIVPSNVDVSCTMDLLDALAPLSVALIDHLIVADKTIVSLRALGKPAPMYWNHPPHRCAASDRWLAGIADWHWEIR